MQALIKIENDVFHPTVSIDYCSNNERNGHTTTTLSTIRKDRYR
jgi:hypothetical protein